MFTLYSGTDYICGQECRGLFADYLCENNKWIAANIPPEKTITISCSKSFINQYPFFGNGQKYTIETYIKKSHHINVIKQKILNDIMDCLPDISIRALSIEIKKSGSREIEIKISLNPNKNITKSPLYSSVICAILRAAKNYIGYSSYYQIDDYLWCENYAMPDIGIFKEIVKKYGIEYVQSINNEIYALTRDGHSGMQDTINKFYQKTSTIHPVVERPDRINSISIELKEKAEKLLNINRIMLNDYSFFLQARPFALIGQFGIKVKNIKKG